MSPSEADRIWGLAFPLLREALDYIPTDTMNDLNVTYSNKAMYVTAKRDFNLEVAKNRLTPVFQRHGWTCLIDQGGHRLVFSPPR